MAKDRSDSDKKEKKIKKEKRSETDGVTKPKTEKDEKKEKKRLKEAAKAAANADAASATTSIVKTVDEKDIKPRAVAVVDADGDTTVTDVEHGRDVKDEAKEQIKKQLLVGSAVPFANPLADEKTLKKVLRGVKKANKNKVLRRGVKECVKAIRKSPTTISKPPIALVILAADISPFDVISHIPVLCEDHHIPYIYVHSRAELGAASSTKRPTSVVMISSTIPDKRKAEVKKEGKEKDDKEDWTETYAELAKVIERAGRDVKI